MRLFRGLNEIMCIKQPAPILVLSTFKLSILILVFGWMVINKRRVGEITFRLCLLDCLSR